MGLRWIAAVIALSPMVFAQGDANADAGEVRGKVVSSRGNEALGQVQVTLTGAGLNMPLRAVTADDGSFQHPRSPARQLRAADLDRRLLSGPPGICLGRRRNQDLRCRPDLLDRSTQGHRGGLGGRIRRRRGAQRAAITLEGEERKNLASVLADDPLRAVQSLPGVTSNNDFSSEFSLRGAPFDRIGLYLDGVLLHSPVPHYRRRSRQRIADHLQRRHHRRHDLVRGRLAGPLFRSHRRHPGGDTREGNRQEIQGTAHGQRFQRRRALSKDRSARSKRGSWLVAFRKSYLQYILNRIDFGDQAPMSFGFTDGQARLTYDLTPKHTVSLSDVEGASDVDRTPFQRNSASTR